MSSNKKEANVTGEKRVFLLSFLLVDDDPNLNRLVRASLGTRKLRRLYEGAIQEHFGGPVDVKSAIHYASNADDARRIRAELAAEYQREKELSVSSKATSELVGHCMVAILDFDMPGENGLQLAASLQDRLVEMMLFTGRQPQMQAFLAESGKSLEDYDVRLAMLKGAPAQEFNDAVLVLIKAGLKRLAGEQR
jgi:CheY-like chemotaxis protein